MQLLDKGQMLIRVVGVYFVEDLPVLFPESIQDGRRLKISDQQDQSARGEPPEKLVDTRKRHFTLLE
jgi:hypothetical protein